jgi:hypothetical protein
MGGTISEAISEFLGQSGMSASTFGKKAIGDPNLVFDLGAGRRLWPETEGKIRKFMADSDVPRSRKGRRP